MIVYGALFPHPPLALPEIGKDRIKDVARTVNSMQMLARQVANKKPETLVFITPHGNVFSDALSVLGLPNLRGNMAAFGRRDVNFHHDNDLELLRSLEREALELKIPLAVLDKEVRGYKLDLELDHGVMVPLRYLEEAGLREAKLLVISIGFLPLLDLYRFGMAVRDAASTLGRRVAVIASGDMSHRLKDEGPYGYNPDGPLFDRLMQEYLSEGRFNDILRIKPEMRENAGECGYRSVIIMLGSLDGTKVEPKLLSYEGPFGVGYLTAGFEPLGQSQESLLGQILEERQRMMAEVREKESALVRYARQVVENFVSQGKKIDPPQEIWSELKKKQAAFVSIKKDGRLRGCIGTIRPTQPNLGLEIRENAIQAATADPRFAPVTKEELPELVYSVDVLSEPEPIKGIEELDPKKYGVIVRKGHKVGVLLPDLEGVDTPQDQVEIACQKAGIRKGESFTLERFTVTRYK